MDVSSVPLMELLSHALRGVIVASPGKVLYVADYSSIEARVLMWLAGEEHGLKLFRDGGNLYLDMAASIYGRPITKADAVEYPVGKFSILGLGYGMGAAKFAATCAGFGVEIDEGFAQEVVNTYREKYWRVKKEWYEQEAAAIHATRTPGRKVVRGYVTWQSRGRFLYCQLPSLRELAYPDPEIHKRPTPWGEEKSALTFMGIDTYTRKWKRQHTYGGSLVENIVQAISRDIMAEAMVRCESSNDYTPVLTVHDEVVAEGRPGLDVKDFEALVAECPDWAPGLPVACEGWSGFRYRKA